MTINADTTTTTTTTTEPSIPAWLNLEPIASIEQLNEMANLATALEGWFDAGVELLHRAEVERSRFEDAIPREVDNLFGFITDRVPEYRYLNSMLMWVANRTLKAAGEDAHFTLSESDLEFLGGATGIAPGRIVGVEQLDDDTVRLHFEGPA